MPERKRFFFHDVFPNSSPFFFNRFTILEKESMLGGTWLKNRYPGCECDVFAHFYSFSFSLVSFVFLKGVFLLLSFRIWAGARRIRGRRKSWTTSTLWRQSLGFFPTFGSTQRLWEVFGVTRQRFGPWRLHLARHSKVSRSQIFHCCDFSLALLSCCHSGNVVVSAVGALHKPR